MLSHMLNRCVWAQFLCQGWWSRLKEHVHSKLVKCGNACSALCCVLQSALSQFFTPKKSLSLQWAQVLCGKKILLHLTNLLLAFIWFNPTPFDYTSLSSPFLSALCSCVSMLIISVVHGMFCTLNTCAILTVVLSQMTHCCCAFTRCDNHHC